MNAVTLVRSDLEQSLPYRSVSLGNSLPVLWSVYKLFNWRPTCFDTRERFSIVLFLKTKNISEMGNKMLWALSMLS